MLRELISKIFGSNKPENVARTPTGPLETIVWPTLEEMASNEMPLYKVVQVKYDGQNYYRFAPSTEEIASHPETRKIAKRLDFPGKWKKLEGHPVALDLFVRELVQKGYDPSKVGDVKGCDAQYNYFQLDEGQPQRVKFTIKGMSSTFGPPNYTILTIDMISSDPKHLDLYFEKR